MTEVTKSNFKEMFPMVEKAIKNASFISVDTEFTGLKLDSSNNASLFDSLDERYQKLRMRASSFIVSQIGLTTFTKCADNNRYNAETYVFFVRPHLCGSIDRLFICQASSFDFLSQYDFDFNKFAKDGIPFINEVEEQKIRNEMTEKCFFHPHEILMERSLKRKQDLLLSEFLLKSKVGDKKIIEKDAICHDYFQVNELRRKYPCLWAYNESDKVVVERVSAETRTELEKSTETELESLLEFYLGFTRIFRLLKEAKKPIIGHNFLMDLLFIFHNFHRPLPKTYKRFKEEMHKVFPIVFDTRHIWLNAKRFYKLGKIPKESSLFDLYHMFQSPPDIMKTLFGPGVIHINGDKYKTDLPHESGFDSYVTGWIFLKICHLLAMNKIHDCAHMEAQTLKQHLKTVEPFKNRVNISLSRTRFIVLDGKDPAPQTPHFIHIAAKNGKLLTRYQLDDTFGRYAMIESRLSRSRKIAILAVGNHGAYKDILRDFKNHEDIVVAEYDIFQHYWPAKTALWIALFGSGVMTAYLVLKLVQLHR